MAGVWKLPPGKSGRKDVDPCDFWRQREGLPLFSPEMLASVLVVISSQLTKLRRKSLEWSVRGFLSGAKRKSHGLLAEARPPLCDGPEIACTFGKRPHTPVFGGQFVVTQILSAKWEIHLQELQGWTSHPSLKVSRRPGNFAQRLCDLGTSPEITWEVAPLENEFSDLLCLGGNLEHAKFDFLRVFAGIFRALICPKRCKRMEILVLSQPCLAIKTVSLLNLKFTKSGPLQNVAGFKPP